MPATSPCAPTCCTTTPPTQVPGTEGTAGANGTDGVNAYTVTTGDILVPAIGATTTASVENTAWMIVGQFLVLDGPAHFQVTDIPSATTVTIEFLGVDGDVSPGATISTGAGVAASGAQGATGPAAALATVATYGAGTAFSLTATADPGDAVVFGTTSPVVVIPSAGKWLLFARVRIDYTGATFAAERTVTLKLRRTNNTATSLTDASASALTRIVTTITGTMLIIEMPPVVYSTSLTTDSITIYGRVSVIPSAGSLDAVQAEIVALKISDTP